MIFPSWWRASAGAGVVLSGAMLLISETLLRPDHEILYDSSLVVADCPAAGDRKLCVAVYLISIANSGRARQADVSVTWAGAATVRQYEAKVTDLVGSRAQRADPEITTGAGDNPVWHIRNLEPNTLVELRMSCMLCPPGEVRALRDAPLHVDARGSVVRADPRGTMFARAIRNFARLLGIARQVPG